MNNLTDHILPWSDSSPDRMAIYLIEKNDSMTYSEFRKRMDVCARNLADHGIVRGSRILIATEMSLDLFVLLPAIFSLGASAVLVERGFNKNQISACIRNSRPDAVVGSRKNLWKLLLLPASWRIRRLDEKNIMKDRNGAALSNDPSDDTLTTALITFTSGSTGTPKGINRTHRTLIAQHRALGRVFSAEEGLVHLTSFPVVSLHNLASGFSTLAATLDDAPERLLEAIRMYNVTSLSGAPYFFTNIISQCLGRGITLPQITSLVIGGAPVQAKTAEDLLKVFPRAQGYVLYGSSEAEPIASIALEEWIRINRKEKHQGYCVGRIVESAKVLIIGTVNGPVSKHQKLNAKLTDEIGEIIVSGDHVTESYYNNPKADAEFKIHDDQGKIWHRTGDLGFFDDRMQLWLVGRSSNIIVHKGRTLYPLQVESVVNRAAGVARSAIVRMNDGKLVLWLIPVNNEASPESAVWEVIHQNEIPVDEIVLSSELPVDARHRSKTDYTKLKTWTPVHYGK